MFDHVGSASDLYSFTHCREALRRQSSMNRGSFFFAEIRRTMSSFSPRGAVSASMSVTNPYLYSRFARASIVLEFVSTVASCSLFTSCFHDLAPRDQSLLTTDRP